MYLEEKKLGETNIDNIGKVLLDAADYIERHGWIQRTYKTNAGKVCATGAIVLSSPRGPDFPVPVIINATARLKKYLGVDHIPVWNDTPGRTKDEIVAALRGAARS
jgi:hypothetical protein